MKPIRMHRAKAVSPEAHSLVLLQGDGGPIVLDRDGQHFGCAHCGTVIVQGRMPGGRLTPVVECGDCGTLNHMPVELPEAIPA